MKYMGGVEINLHAILTSAQDCGERSALRTYRFTLEGKKAPYILWRLVGPRDGVDAVEKRKHFRFGQKPISLSY